MPKDHKTKASDYLWERTQPVTHIGAQSASPARHQIIKDLEQIRQQCRSNILLRLVGDVVYAAWKIGRAEG